MRFGSPVSGSVDRGLVRPRESVGHDPQVDQGEDQDRGAEQPERPGGISQEPHVLQNVVARAEDADDRAGQNRRGVRNSAAGVLDEVRQHFDRDEDEHDLVDREKNVEIVHARPGERQRGQRGDHGESRHVPPPKGPAEHAEVEDDVEPENDEDEKHVQPELPADRRSRLAPRGEPGELVGGDREGVEKEEQELALAAVAQIENQSDEADRADRRGEEQPEQVAAGPAPERILEPLDSRHSGDSAAARPGVVDSERQDMRSGAEGDRQRVDAIEQRGLRVDGWKAARAADPASVEENFLGVADLRRGQRERLLSGAGRNPKPNAQPREAVVRIAALLPGSGDRHGTPAAVVEQDLPRSGEVRRQPIDGEFPRVAGRRGRGRPRSEERGEAEHENRRPWKGHLRKKVYQIDDTPTPPRRAQPRHSRERGEVDSHLKCNR